MPESPKPLSGVQLFLSTGSAQGNEGGKLASSAPEPQGMFEGQGDGLS